MVFKVKGLNFQTHSYSNSYLYYIFLYFSVFINFSHHSVFGDVYFFPFHFNLFNAHQVFVFRTLNSYLALFTHLKLHLSQSSVLGLYNFVVCNCVLCCFLNLKIQPKMINHLFPSIFVLKIDLKKCWVVLNWSRIQLGEV